jgi:ribosomal protein S18 acetylase RimI-like enzyme
VVTEPLQDLSTRALIRAVEAHRRFNVLNWGNLAGVVVHDSPRMVLFITGLPVAWANGVDGAHLRPSDADRAIRDAVRTFRRAGVAATWTVGPWTRPKDLGRRLVAHGFRRLEALPWMAADLSVRRRLPRPPGLKIERVRTVELHRTWVDMMIRGFHSDRTSRITLDRLGRHDPNQRAGPWVRFVGFVDGRPVASSGLVAGSGVAGIYNVATLPSKRRRGIGTAMTLAAMRHGKSLGYRVAILGTSPSGRGVYQRLGFTDVCITQDYVLDVPR